MPLVSKEASRLPLRGAVGIERSHSTGPARCRWYREKPVDWPCAIRLASRNASRLPSRDPFGIGKASRLALHDPFGIGKASRLALHDPFGIEKCQSTALARYVWYRESQSSGVFGSETPLEQESNLFRTVGPTVFDEFDLQPSVASTQGLEFEPRNSVVEGLFDVESLPTYLQAPVVETLTPSAFALHLLP